MTKIIFKDNAYDHIIHDPCCDTWTCTLCKREYNRTYIPTGDCPACFVFVVNPETNITEKQIRKLP